MTEQIIREYHVATFRGKPPEVNPAEGVDLEDIRQNDPNPMFVTLPIAEIGAISKNGLLYDEALVDSIATQINTDRPGGIFGHLKDEDRNTSFPLPAGLWVGAKRVGETLWAKAWVPPGAAKDYVRSLKSVGGQIATSIYGRAKRFEQVSANVRRAVDFKLESLDFAPPSRAALGLGAVPHVTTEFEHEQEAEMPADKQQVIAELTVNDIPDKLREQIVAEAAKQGEVAQTIAELEGAVQAKDEVIAELQRAVEAHRVERLNAAIDAKIAELTDWSVTDDEGKAKLANLRALLRGQVITRLGDKQSVDRVAEISEAAWEDIKPIAELVRDALAGPAATVSGKVQNGGGYKPQPIEDTPEIARVPRPAWA